MFSPIRVVAALDAADGRLRAAPAVPSDPEQPGYRAFLVKMPAHRLLEGVIPPSELLSNTTVVHQVRGTPSSTLGMVSAVPLTMFAAISIAMALIGVESEGSGRG